MIHGGRTQRDGAQRRLRACLIAAFSSVLLCVLSSTTTLASSPPLEMQVMDQPGDDGSTILLLLKDLPADEERAVAELFSQEGSVAGLFGEADKLRWSDHSFMPQVWVGGDHGDWHDTESAALLAAALSTKADFPQYFGFNPPDPATLVIPISGYLVPDDAGGDPAAMPLTPGQDYPVRVVFVGADLSVVATFSAGKVTPTEQWFNPAKANNLIICVMLSLIILGSIAAARRNPNLFIRRINGLEAVDEAVGRATEMGKPVFHINGLDGLAVLSTLAGVNILGRIARITANYETQLVVPAFDPVVLNVSQEVVRQSYLEAGRPDAYRADDIFFVTDQQFSYVASVCGMMLRDRPAAIFMLGSFYAESLMLAETGASTGAIQIAGTDQQAQLPFFITTCDYTLIGEELYAASAYLSREPLLLGSLKGQDIGKALIVVLILTGVVLSTFFDSQWLSHVFTAF